MRLVVVVLSFVLLVAPLAAQTTACPSRVAHLVYPPDGATNVGATLTGQTRLGVLFAWNPVRNAAGYNLFVGQGGGAPVMIGPTITDQAYEVVPLAQGKASWYVQTVYDGNCPPTTSDTAQFTVAAPPCAAPSRTAASVIRSVTTGEQYDVRWRPVLGATHYQLQESTSPDMSGSTTYEVDGAEEQVQHDVTAPTAYYYRVRGVAACNQSNGPYSTIVRTVIVPKPAPTHPKPTYLSQAGTRRSVIHSFFIPGRGSKSDPSDVFVITDNKPWLSVRPACGPLPPDGTTVQVTIDPTQIDAGSHTAIITYRVASACPGSTNEPVVTSNFVPAPNDTTPVNVPLSISLVTPVNPQTKPDPLSSSLIIPAVSHAFGGADSQWQSDIRLTNPGAHPQTYQITFTPSGTDVSQSEVHVTTVEIDPGDTTAIDDIISQWYGFGALNDGLNGMLQITPIDNFGNPVAGNPRSLAVASSRTYDVTPNGTLGQFIPAIPFAQFISQSTNQSQPTRLSLQQVSQTADFRTNLGLLEASGQPASVLLKVFDNFGRQTGSSVPMSIAAGQQFQIGSFLATVPGIPTVNGVPTLTDGRIEVSVTSSTGKVMAYASMVDNHTNDPLMVAGIDPSKVSAARYVVPGIADINNGSIHWRSDVRLYNPGTTSVSTTATFYPTANAAPPISVPLVVPAGQVAAINNILESLFGLTNVLSAGGSLVISTASAAQLVATARTYDQDGPGTYGQFVPAVTPADAVGSADPPLQILQVEQSDAFRTNVGVAEVTGNPATIEITVYVPDSKVTPIFHQDLQPNEFLQFNSLLASLGYPVAYNTRVSIRVLSGTGRVTAYASVVDNKTQDPTFVPAQ
ncbi:MAG TPA: hypothetical protein VEZ11_08475 [Thermoanaerobaculia bacterium]|nr:hypothetical protein [Thermoanaerobaculia bacterium]